MFFRYLGQHKKTRAATSDVVQQTARWETGAEGGGGGAAAETTQQ